MLDSNTLERSSILGALKPDASETLIIVLDDGKYTNPMLPVTAILFCVTAVSGKCKKELSSTLLFNRTDCKRSPSFSTSFLLVNL